MSCVSDGQYGCGFGLAQVAVESHARKRGELVVDPGFDPSDRGSFPRTTHRGNLHGMAGAGWNHVLGHTDWCVRLRKVVESDMARFKQTVHPRPRIPRLVALHGTVHRPPYFIGGNSQTSLFNELLKDAVTAIGRRADH